MSQTPLATTAAGIETPIRLYAAARLIGRSPAGLRLLLKSGGGPPALRVGRLLMFKPSQLRHWLDSCAEA